MIEFLTMTAAVFLGVFASQMATRQISVVLQRRRERKMTAAFASAIAEMTGGGGQVPCGDPTCEACYPLKN